MTLEESKKIIEIMMTADMECYFCVTDLLNQFGRRFPNEQNLITLMFKDKYPNGGKLNFKEPF